MKRTPTGTWWNALSLEQRRKVIRCINGLEDPSVSVSENNRLFRWSRLDRFTRSQLETFREVEVEMKYVERHQGLGQVSNKHW